MACSHRTMAVQGLIFLQKFQTHKEWSSPKFLTFPPKRGLIAGLVNEERGLADLAWQDCASLMMRNSTVSEAKQDWCEENCSSAFRTRPVGDGGQHWILCFQIPTFANIAIIGLVESLVAFFGWFVWGFLSTEHQLTMNWSFSDSGFCPQRDISAGNVV